MKYELRIYKNDGWVLIAPPGLSLVELGRIAKMKYAQISVYKYELSQIPEDPREAWVIIDSRGK